MPFFLFQSEGYLNQKHFPHPCFKTPIVRFFSKNVEAFLFIEGKNIKSEFIETRKRHWNQKVPQNRLDLKKMSGNISEIQRGASTPMIQSNFYLQPTIPVPTRTIDFVLEQVRTCN